jgi:hypothetical protein
MERRDRVNNAKGQRAIRKVEPDDSSYSEGIDWYMLPDCSRTISAGTTNRLPGFEPKIVTYDVTGYASSAGGSEHGSQDKRNSVTIKERSGRGSQDGSGMSDATDEFYINNAEGYVLYE